MAGEGAPSTGLSQLLGAIRDQAGGSQRRIDHLTAAVEGALAECPERGRAGALAAMRELRSEALQWVARAQQLQGSYATMSVAPTAAAADAHEAQGGDDSKSLGAGPGMCKMLIVEDSSFQERNPPTQIITPTHTHARTHAPFACPSLAYPPLPFHFSIVLTPPPKALTMLALAEECGYSAHVVPSAEESKAATLVRTRISILSRVRTALEVLEHDEDVNLVLTDVMMSGTDGYQLLRQIRSSYKAHIAVVMCSAVESASLVEQCVAQCVPGYQVSWHCPRHTT
ncbi:hypothetical protein T492DRAFT_1131161 [Pavlovales sp. CCMP2436]|nr:hypothetical protein T492DRAFT_1131161 [Pavlovales sp. CCMP2436]